MNKCLKSLVLLFLFISLIIPSQSFCTTRAIQIDILMSGITNPSTGTALSGGTVYFYAAGTTTAKNVWTEKEKTNPYSSYTLSSTGTAQLYGEGNYKLVFKNSLGVTVLTLDNIRLEFPYYGIRSVSSTGSQLSQDDFLLVDTTSGAVTINALTASSWTRPLKIQRIAGSNAIIFDPYGSETIDAVSTITWNSDSIVEIISDSSNLRSAGYRSSFSDSDNDTKIQVEESADEDKVRIDTGGVERVVVDSNGITVSGTTSYVKQSASNASLYLAGGTDDTDGGSIDLFGSSAAGTPNSVNIRTNNTSRMLIDADGNVSGSIILDEDDMASNSATKFASQQSTKAYVDNTNSVYVNSGNGNIAIGSGFDVGAAIGAAWETIGPTGSGATNIWSALDVVPTGASWIKIKIRNYSARTSGADALLASTLYARKNGSSSSVDEGTIISERQAYGGTTISAYATGVNTMVIPINAVVFELYYILTNQTDVVVNIYLLGWGFN